MVCRLLIGLRSFVYKILGAYRFQQYYVTCCAWNCKEPLSRVEIWVMALFIFLSNFIISIAQVYVMLALHQS